MTNAALSTASVGRILAAPWQQNRREGRVWFLVLIALCATLAPAAILIFDADAAGRVSLARDLGIGEACLATMGAWALVVASLLAQNEPVSARLVPAHVRDLRAAMVLAGAGAVALPTALLGPLTGSPLLVALASALLAAWIAAAARWRSMLYALSFSPIAVTWFRGTSGWSTVGDMARVAWQAAPCSLAAVVMVACVAFHAALIQTGGAAHVRNHDARKERSARRRLRAIGAERIAPDEGSLQRFTRLRLWAYGAWMRRLVERRDAPTMPRLMLSLGPSTHWTTQFVNVALLVMTAVVVVGLLALFSDPRTSPALAGDLLAGWSFGAIFTFVAPALRLPARLRQAHREQALLVLLPGVPRGPALSRCLSMHLSVQFLSVWLIGVAGMAVGAGVGRWLQADLSHSLFDDLSPFLATGLLMSVAPAFWRSWARMAPQTQLSSAWLFLFPAATMLVGTLLLHRGLASRSEIVLALAAASLAWCALRWWRMGREPTAFPVGRLHAG